jgi:hypothetical protein
MRSHCTLLHACSLLCLSQVRSFAAENKLSGPVGINFFEVEKNQ